VLGARRTSPAAWGCAAPTRARLLPASGVLAAGADSRASTDWVRARSVRLMLLCVCRGAPRCCVYRRPRGSSRRRGPPRLSETRSCFDTRLPLEVSLRPGLHGYGAPAFRFAPSGGVRREIGEYEVPAQSERGSCFHVGGGQSSAPEQLGEEDRVCGEAAAEPRERGEHVLWSIASDLLRVRAGPSDAHQWRLSDCRRGRRPQPRSADNCPPTRARLPITATKRSSLQTPDRGQSVLCIGTIWGVSGRPAGMALTGSQPFCSGSTRGASR
jgi:hypothetical protein